MGKIVAIIGTAPSSRLEANDQPAEVERWGTSGTWEYIERLDRWFEIHERAWKLRRMGKDYFPYLRFMQQFQGPVYMTDPDPSIPGAVRYPRDILSEHFFGEDHPYWTSSIAYMTAFAIYEGVSEIRYFGVDMSHKMEYIEQRQGCEYFMGWARAVGIKVSLPESSPILKAAIYGARKDTKVLQETILERQESLQSDLGRLSEALITVRGQLQEILVSNGTKRPSRTNRYRTLVANEKELVVRLSHLRGKLSENDRWLEEEKGLHQTELALR